MSENTYIDINKINEEEKTVFCRSLRTVIMWLATIDLYMMYWGTSFLLPLNDDYTCWHFFINTFFISMWKSSSAWGVRTVAVLIDHDL